MERIRHKKYGEGVVVDKVVKGNRVYLSVQFDSGYTMELSPASFTTGVVTADAELMEEMLKIAAAQQAEVHAETEKRKDAVRIAPTAVATSSGSRSSGKRWTPTCALASAYEKYLIARGYKIESDKGNPSTVYAYGNAVDNIAGMEGLTWAGLANDIDNAVQRYGEGGAREAVGEKSNSTYINALLRFKEMLESN